MSSKPADIKIGVNLIDDYLYLQQPEINTGDLLGRFLVVQDGATNELASELLTVDKYGPNATVLTGEVEAMLGYTPYGSFGSVPAIAGCVLALLLMQLLYLGFWREQD